MLRLYYAVNVAILFVCTMSYARVVVKEQELFYKEEQVDGKLFSHRYETRHDAAGSALKEVWKIDGKEVSAQVYEEAILEAEKNERRLQRAQEEQARCANFEFKEKAQRAVVTKLLGKVTQNLVRDIQTIERYGLGAYAVFSDSTLSVQGYQELVTVLIPRAQALGQENLDFAQLQDLYNRLEPLQDRMRLFMRATIDRAIEKCDDTKFLKDLLTLVS